MVPSEWPTITTSRSPEALDQAQRVRRRTAAGYTAGRDGGWKPRDRADQGRSPGGRPQIGGQPAPVAAVARPPCRAIHRDAFSLVGVEDRLTLPQIESGHLRPLPIERPGGHHAPIKEPAAVRRARRPAERAGSVRSRILSTLSRTVSMVNCGSRIPCARAKRQTADRTRLSLDELAVDLAVGVAKPRDHRRHDPCGAFQEHVVVRGVDAQSLGETASAEYRRETLPASIR